MPVKASLLSGEQPKTPIQLEGLVHRAVWQLGILFRFHLSLYLYIAIWGSVRPSVRPSICPSIGPRFFFESAKTRAFGFWTEWGENRGGGRRRRAAEGVREGVTRGWTHLRFGLMRKWEDRKSINQFIQIGLSALRKGLWWTRRPRASSTRFRFEGVAS